MQRSFSLLRTAGASNALVVKPFFCIIPTIDRPKCLSLAAESGGAYVGVKGANVWRAGKRITAVRSTVNNGVESSTSSSSNAGNPEPLSQLPDWSGITYTRLQLRPEPQLPPRVEHLLVEREGRVVDVVAESLDLPTEYVTDLIRFGGIYHAQVPPPPPPNLPPEALQAYLEFIAQHTTDPSSSPSSPTSASSSSSSSPSSSSHKPKVTLAELQKVRRVEVGGVRGRCVGQKEKRQRQRSRDKVGKKGSGSGRDLRGKRDGRDGRGEENHQQQKQKQKQHQEGGEEEEEYGVGGTVGNLVECCTSFGGQVVGLNHPLQLTQLNPPIMRPMIHRPSVCMLQVGGTVDNLVECCAFFGGQAVGLIRPLQLTHQLDLCTQGCVVMAKNRQFASRFNQLLQNRKVRKLYKALTASAPAPGRHIHFMLPDPYSPKILTREAMPGWQRCELVIRRVEEVPWPADSVLAAADVDCSYWPAADVAYECLVELITGRTHQLRAQFAALGAPLIGDTMYGPSQAQQAAPMVLKATIPSNRGSDGVKGNGVESLGQERRKEFVDAEVLSQAKHLFGEAPEAAIGLQAFSEPSFESDSKAVLSCFRAGAIVIWAMPRVRS
ncbi:unnamed protein product [Closterium sp. NIES-65]|nr:unnamed protein product [Closterium sp. NIES-65]